MIAMSKLANDGVVMETVGALKASEMLGMSRRQIARWCRSGRLKGSYQRDPGNSRSGWIIPFSSVEEIKMERARQAGR